MLYCICFFIVDIFILKYINEFFDDCIVCWIKLIVMGKRFFGMFNFEDIILDGIDKNGNELEKLEIFVYFIRSEFGGC